MPDAGKRRNEKQKKIIPTIKTIRKEFTYGSLFNETQD